MLESVSSAYERQRILAKRDFPGAPPATLADVQRVAYQNQFKKRRQHRKTEGLIGFQALSNLIATRWRNLSPSERALFEYQATVEKVKRDHAMKEWKRREKQLKQGKHTKSTHEKKQEQAPFQEETTSRADASSTNVATVLHKAINARHQEHQNPATMMAATTTTTTTTTTTARASITPSPTATSSSGVNSSSTRSSPQHFQASSSATNTMVALLQATIANQQEQHMLQLRQQQQQQQQQQQMLPVFHNAPQVPPVTPAASAMEYSSSLQGLTRTTGSTITTSPVDKSGNHSSFRPHDEQPKDEDASSCWWLLQPTPLAPNVTPAQIRSHSNNNTVVSSTTSSPQHPEDLPEYHDNTSEDLFATLWLENEPDEGLLLSNNKHEPHVLGEDDPFPLDAAFPSSLMMDDDHEALMIVG